MSDYNQKEPWKNDPVFTAKFPKLDEKKKEEEARNYLGSMSGPEDPVFVSVIGSAIIDN